MKLNKRITGLRKGTWFNREQEVLKLDRFYKYSVILGQPNGGTSQNCAQISSSVLGYLLDNYCTYTSSYLCEFQELGTLKLKGLCYDSVIDTVYSVVNDKTFIKYNGYIDTDIVYNMETQQWNIIYEEEIVGTSLASQEFLLLGIISI